MLFGGLRGGRSLLKNEQMAGADPLRGAWHLVPQLEDPGQQRELLGLGKSVPGRRSRLPGAHQRPGSVVRVIPVMGLLDQPPAGGDQPGIGAEDLGEAGVQPGTLARQQVVVDGLADERVPERVSVLVRSQHVGCHRGPQPASEVVVGQPGHRRQQRVPAALPARARCPQQLLRLLGQPLHRGEQQVAQRLGQLGAQAAVAAQQLLDEQRVALGTLVYLVSQPRLRLAADDAGRKLIGLQPAQPGQLHPLHPAEPAQLGEQRPQRMGPVKLVGPVADDDQYAVQDLLAADEERHQVAG